MFETFTGDNVPTLLGQAQAKLGRDAVVVRVRRIGRQFELTASAGSQPQAIAPRRSAPQPEFGRVLFDKVQAAAVPVPQPRAVAPAAPATPVARTTAAAKPVTYSAPKTPYLVAATLPTVKPAPAPVAKPAPQPVARPVPTPVAKPAPWPAAKPAPQPAARPAAVAAVKPAAPPAPVAPPRAPAGTRPLIIALVGPTGTGKTTTIAKLATNPAAYGGKRVGLLGLDTYRIGAPEQLKTYGELADLPVAIVREEPDLARGLKQLAKCEVILVDVPGRGPKNRADSARMIRWLGQIRPDEMHLTLPMGQQPALIRRTIDSFRPYGFTHLLATKLDEFRDDWILFDIAVRLNLAMRWVADGQDVPHDLRSATSRIATARLALREREAKAKEVA